MISEMLYKKYRPYNFDNFFGNQGLVTVIKNSIKNHKISHAYLFSGPRGTGKTSMARLIVRSLNCLNLKDGYNPCGECVNCKSITSGTFPDILELDAASNRGIEEIRAIKESVNYKPLTGRYKVYIIDEVHMLTKEAFNALLKTLEEPPKHVIFILATTEPEKVLETIRSRCQKHDLSLLDSSAIKRGIQNICKAEGYEISDESCELIAQEAGYSMRDSLSLLEKVLCSISTDKISLRDVEESLGTISHEEIEKMYSTYSEGKVSDIFNIIDDFWSRGYKIESLMKSFANRLRKEVSQNSHIAYHIAEIYRTLNDYRYEENKKAVGYLAITRIVPNVNSNNREHASSKDSKTKENLDKNRVVTIEKEDLSSNKIEIKEELHSKKLEEKEAIIEVDANFETIKDIWKDVLLKAKEHSIALMVYLTSADLYDFKEDKLHILYDKEHSFHKESVSKKENLLILEDIISKKIGINISVIVSYKEDMVSSKSFEDRVKEIIEI